MRKVPAPVVSVGGFAARDVFTEAVVEKFELKYVRSARVEGRRVVRKIASSIGHNVSYNILAADEFQL